MNCLQVNNVVKYFENRLIIDNISFDNGKSDILGILGPNGAGKTTLLRLITGLLIPDSGSIMLNGKAIKADFYQSFGYIPEERGLYPSLTVLEQVIYFASLKGINTNQAKQNAKYWLDRFKISDKITTSTGKLSKGNQQIVQIICAISHNPSLLILDEPMSGFDPNNVVLFNDIIQEIANQGTSIIISTHNMNAVERLCNKIIFIDSGKNILNGTIIDIKNQFSSSIYKIITTSPIATENKYLTINSIRNIGSQYIYSITANNGITNNELIKSLIQQSELLHYEKELPRLEDIFIKLTRRNNE